MDTIWKNKPCPFLPELVEPVTHQDMANLGDDRGARFYETALKYAQSLWRSGFPAKALLLCSRAMAADVYKDCDALHRWPLPYRAVAWILVNQVEGQFIGNPRRHYQHLATRMVGPMKDLRAWRAWACWYLAKELLHPAQFPGDSIQIRREGIIEPMHDEITQQLRRFSSLDDDRAWNDALHWSQQWRHNRPLGRHRIHLRPADKSELSIIRQLAYYIWPRVYPGIISDSQIRYMLERFYDLGVMWDEMQRRGVFFALIEVDGKPAGYLSFEPLRTEKAAFLHKLYVLPDFHGIGAGALALQWVEQVAARIGLRYLKLRVNKHNDLAIRAYLRQGFQFAGDEVSEIGGGFVMDDYWMEKTIGR